MIDEERRWSSGTKLIALSIRGARFKPIFYLIKETRRLRFGPWWIRIFYPEFLRPKIHALAKIPLRFELPVALSMQGLDQDGERFVLAWTSLRRDTDGLIPQDGPICFPYSLKLNRPAESTLPVSQRGELMFVKSFSIHSSS
jgi:hypothetical protein